MSANAVRTVIRKRDGRENPFDLRKVEAFLRKLSWGLDHEFVDVQRVLSALTRRLPDDVMNAEVFQIFLAETVSTFSSHHPDYSVLAGRVYTEYIHKRVPKRFSTWVFTHDASSPSLFTSTFLDTVRDNASLIDEAIMHYRDFDFTYHAMQTFERSYFLRSRTEVNERLQFLYMRVAIGIHGDDLDGVLQTYELMSTRMMSLASTILWNGGLSDANYASCYIYEPFAVEPKDAISNFSALSAMWAADGGIGINAGEIPATSRDARRGKHPGLMPLLRVYDSLASYWSRSSRHRSSSATIHLPIWHADVRKFVTARTSRPSPGYRFRHLFPALWIPHLFMRRLEADEIWSLFDPADVRPLADLAGDAFISAYESYERNGLAVATVPAQTLWELVSISLRETGTPFLLFSDNINEHNNHSHLGIIKASNLCTEIVQYSSSIETAVCTLASLCLPQYVRSDRTFDYAELHRVTKLVVRILDKLIDRSHFPTPDSIVSAYSTRAIGVGVQGLADVFAMMGKPFDSPDARDMNIHISETIYHASLESSCELAERSEPYESWEGSPASQGTLQIDMWPSSTTRHYDFEPLRHSEGIEPFSSNIVQYRVISGTFDELSRHLVSALSTRGLWMEQVRTAILAAHGSVQDIDDIPDDVKAVFRTAYELDPHVQIDMAAARSPFIDQSQSFSLFVTQPTSSHLMDLALHAWRSGLKTGAYYIRSKSPVDPQPFGLDLPSMRPRPSSPQTFTTPVSTLSFNSDAQIIRS